MTEYDENVVVIRDQEALGGRNGNGGNGNLVRYRLGELERRMGVLEAKLDALIVTCTQIDERQADLANKSYVLWIFGVTAAVLALTLVGHMFIRSMGGA